MPKKTDVLQFPIPRTCPLHLPQDYARLRSERGLPKVRLWNGNEAWLLTRYEDVRAVLLDPRFSADTRLPNFPSPSPGMSVARGKYRSFVSMDDPEHDYHRKMVAAEFGNRRIEVLRPKIQSIVDALIDDMLAHDPPVDFVKTFALPLPSKVICMILGVPYEAHEFFQERAEIMVSSTTTIEQSEKAARELIDEYLGDLIDRKISEPADDLLSRLVNDHLVSGELSRFEVLSTARLLLMAGHDTTSNVTALSLVTLLRHPEQLRALKKDPALVPHAVEELFRFLDPTQGGRRRVALEDLEINGHSIKAGDAVVALNNAADRDGQMFEQPDTFDIRRRPKSHLAFGGGIHKCLGQSLAREELKTVLHKLFARVPTIGLAIPFEEISFSDERVVYGIQHLPVTW